MEKNPSEKSDKQGPHLSFSTTEPTGFGRGWISGIFAAIMGVVALGTVVCFHFPALTIPVLRGQYPIELIRIVLEFILIASFVLGTISIFLRQNKMLGLIAIGCSLLALLLGGANVEIGNTSQTTGLGLDWFILNLVLYSAVFIPLERLFAKHPEQPTFRSEWTVDLTYFFINMLIIQITSFLILQPAKMFFDWAHQWSFGFVSDWPIYIQVLLCLLIADFFQYWVHRAFHAVPYLWRFHAIHHSAECMDWLAGARLHIVDVLCTRGLTYIPIYVLGFSEPAIITYVVIVVVQATFIHSNIRWELSWIKSFIATPHFHHWHHAAEKQAIDKNFSVHSVLWDWLFGTYYNPKHWPKKYGIMGKRDVPFRWVTQLIYPFMKRKK